MVTTLTDILDEDTTHVKLYITVAAVRHSHCCIS